MAEIKINDKVFNGKVIKILGGTLTIDDKGMQKIEGIVRIEVTGDLANIVTDSSVIVDGNVYGDIQAEGSVTCGDVTGNISAEGSVTCGKVNGNVSAEGTIISK
ncbi:MAG: polymer-forming cytoskeletal protein [Desulfobacterales bacterium]|nr:polymer-forming cytoskeletal protein [Desulfobacterales bacterium]